MTTDSKNTCPYEPDSCAEMLGTEKVANGPGWSRVRMPIRKRHLQSAGNVQGGLIVALADEAIGDAVSTLLPTGQRTVTVEIKVNFLAPANQGELVAEAHIHRKGGTLAVGEVRVTDKWGTLVAVGLGTWMLFRPRPQ